MARAPLNDGVDALDGSRREPGNGDLPVVAMLGRIHPDDRAHLADPVLGTQCNLLLAAFQDDAESVQEEVGLLGDLADVRMAHDWIEGVEAQGLAVLQSIQFAQLAPLIMRNAKLPVGSW